MGLILFGPMSWWYPCSFVQLTVPSLFVTRWAVWQSSELLGTNGNQHVLQWEKYVSVFTGVLHLNIVKQILKGQSLHLLQA